MKTKFRMLQWILVLVFAVGTSAVMAQQPYPNTGDQVVCVDSVVPYGVTLTTGSSYVWQIAPAGGGTITIGATPNLISVHWTTKGTYILSVTETNSFGCVGTPQTQQIIVNPLPLAVATPAAQTVCSGTAITTIALTTSNVVPGTTFAWTRDNLVNVTGLPISGAGDIAGTLVNTTGVSQTVTFTIIPTSGAGCDGPSITATVTVNSAPVVNPMVASVCSGSAIGVVLPAISANGLNLTTYDITAVLDAGLTGTATTGNGINNINAIAGDIFTNTTGAPLNVTYTVTPYAGACVGAAFTITVQINPAPVVNPLTAAVCSGSAIGVVLPAVSANGLNLTAYDITAVLDAGLTGTATTGNGIINVNAIAGDIFTNTTAGPLNVTYTVTPHAGICVGASFTITVTINPAPVVNPMTAAVCSGSAIGVVLPAISANGLNLTAYDIAAILDAGLTGTATTGNGIINVNAIAGDIFTNTTAGPLNVTYTVTPHAGACVGASFTITVTINPAPVVNPMTAAVCSGSTIGVVLPAISANGLNLTAYDITAVLDAGLTGTATTGNGIINVNAIAGDIFTNTTAGPLNVTYTVTPHAGACAGASFTITVTINPAPVVNPMVSSVCSGIAIGVVLPATSANGINITTYDITAVLDAGLTGTATTGNGINNVNAIAGDIFTNTTGGLLNVTYTVIPHAGTCVGAAFTITVTIKPQPTTSPIYHN